jgi:beta-galactosidase
LSRNSECVQYHVLLDRQTVKRLGHLEWSVKYEPGTIEARATKDGKVVLIAPVAIKLSADRMEIDADGQDVSMIRVELLDKEGRSIPTADNTINFKITGEGALLGVGNGDPNCQESDKEPKRSLFSGLARVIVQSTRKAGTITVEAHAEEWPGPKLPSVTLSIATKRV